ncbi:MAG: hypothetical protein FRX49_09332 [Trebouxia sp. A1-2]|nr:MAG: hypothetical protein FRX49_09332 [Trebouxia sp. A1-2]
MRICHGIDTAVIALGTGSRSGATQIPSHACLASGLSQGKPGTNTHGLALQHSATLLLLGSPVDGFSLTSLQTRWQEKLIGRAIKLVSL